MVRFSQGIHQYRNWSFLSQKKGCKPFLMWCRIMSWDVLMTWLHPGYILVGSTHLSHICIAPTLWTSNLWGKWMASPLWAWHGRRKTWGRLCNKPANHPQKPMVSNICIPLFNHPMAQTWRNDVKCCQKWQEMHTWIFFHLECLGLGSLVDAPMYSTVNESFWCEPWQKWSSKWKGACNFTSFCLLSSAILIDEKIKRWRWKRWRLMRNICVFDCFCVSSRCCRCCCGCCWRDVSLHPAVFVCDSDGQHGSGGSHREACGNATDAGSGVDFRFRRVWLFLSPVSQFTPSSSGQCCRWSGAVSTCACSGTWTCSSF